MNTQKPVVLITGCSSGIGLALAREFAAAGCRIVATARKPDTIRQLQGETTVTMQLDITDPGSIKRCISSALKQEGHIDILVNNAGYGLMGPMVETPPEEMRRQFETNVIGALALSQAVAPGMIERRSGRIVNISSVSGVLTSAFAGPYCASKAALNAVSDALRLELAPFGIRVITVQPGAIASNFGNRAAESLLERHGKPSPYAPIAEFVNGRAEYSQKNPTGADDFARRMVKKVLAKNPPPLIRIGRESVKLPLVKWLLPVRISDRLIAKTFGLDRL
ncbi:MAG: SDR family NAD(P)-dependent oxidoreductase [Spirochaetes bacterium]|nr:SDR family NAD(P)-dependent oxidoreductase [Spirochaetota bacterium]